jgi:hypothetical protein
LGKLQKHKTLSPSSKSVNQLFNEASDSSARTTIASEVLYHGRRMGACSSYQYVGGRQGYVSTPGCHAASTRARVRRKLPHSAEVRPNYTVSPCAFGKTLIWTGLPVTRDASVWCIYQSSTPDQAEKDNHNIYQEKVPFKVPDKAKQLAGYRRSTPPP